MSIWLINRTSEDQNGFTLTKTSRQWYRSRLSDCVGLLHQKLGARPNGIERYRVAKPKQSN